MNPTKVSIIYLSLSEAISLTFLSPIGSIIFTQWLSSSTIQWIDCVGAGGALFGALLIAQPKDVFEALDSSSGMSGQIHRHLKGLVFGVLGVCGGVVGDYNDHCD